MVLGRVLNNAVLSADRFLSGIQLKAFERRGCLLTLVFHNLFLSREEMEIGVHDPQEAVTVGQFRQMLEYFSNAGYEFVTPSDILRGLDAARRHILVTFDDGYFNNHRALPILEECGASALFFISANHVKLGKAFWWDVLYRAGRDQHRPAQEIEALLAKFKRMTTDKIEEAIIRMFGEGAFKPIGDLDRPFTPAELREFARNHRVFIGNHTCNHAILDAYSPAGAGAEIAGAQDFLEGLTGVRPIAIAYPNGSWNPEIARLAQAAGLRLGFTGDRKKEHLASESTENKLMALGRFWPNAQEEVLGQCRLFRSDLMLHTRYRRLKNAVLPAPRN